MMRRRPQPASCPHFAKCDPLVIRAILSICAGKDAFLYPGDRGPVDFLASALMRLLLEEFERFPDLMIEGCGGHLVFFRPRKILEPAAFPRFQDEVRTLARLFPGEISYNARVGGKL